MTYRYVFDHTIVGNWKFRREDYKFIQAGLKSLLKSILTWNRKAIENGALKKPYEQEQQDLSNMVSFGKEQLDDENGRYITIHGISVGSLRYIKAALLLEIKYEEDAINARREQKWPEGVISSLENKVDVFKRLAEKIEHEPANILWEIVPRKTIHRDKETVIERTKSMKWDVFICHASEDKEGLVRPLANLLISYGLKVWYDEFTLTVGDGLRRSIDKGLANSRYGIVVMSPNFLRKEWPQKELDGLASLEVDGRKVILPVWHEIEVDEVRRYSPTLADRVATSSKKGLEQVVADLLGAMELGIEKQNIAGTKGKSTVHTQENLDEEELKLLLAVERSGNNGCYFPTLVQILGMSETRTKYYLDKLSHDKHLLDWIGNMSPGVPDRYTLNRKGRDFLVEGGYV